MRAAVLAFLALLPALAAGALAAGGAPAPEQRQADLRQAYRRPADIPFPPENPYSEPKRALGERLFFEPLLSAGNTMSCASCHKPDHGFSDGRPLAVGEAGQVGPHHTPTLYNLAWAGSLFWDGRSPSLEAQAVGPMANPVEMAQDLSLLPAELEAAPGYRAQFAAAFPEDPRITNDNVAKAIATYERTLVTPIAPFDRWVEGDEDAIDAAAKRGFALFNGSKAGCANCHSGWDFTDGGFYDTGLPATGAGRSAVVPQPRLANAWKTPTLRNLTGRGPYMHDGSLPTVEAVIDHYADTVVMRSTLPRELPRRIALNKAERADLVAFLRTLDSGNPATVRIAVAPPPADVAPPPPSRQVEVTQKNTAFSQKKVRLLPGGKLVIHNEDTRSHNIRVYAPDMDYDSGIQDPGQSVEVGFDKGGTYHAVCNIHPRMKLEVEVGP